MALLPLLALSSVAIGLILLFEIVPEIYAAEYQANLTCPGGQ